MSMCYWMCEGIGIATSALVPYLDVDKCTKLICEQTSGEIVSNKEDFDINDYLYGEVFENLADMLCHCDNSEAMTYGDNGDGESYFYYTKTYPWERLETEPKSIEEVHSIIKDAVQRVCNLTRDEIEEMINDDIYDFGCG